MFLDTVCQTLLFFTVIGACASRNSQRIFSISKNRAKNYRIRGKRLSDITLYNNIKNGVIENYYFFQKTKKKKFKESLFYVPFFQQNLKVKVDRHKEIQEELKKLGDEVQVLDPQHKTQKKQLDSIKKARRDTQV